VQTYTGLSQTQVSTPVHYPQTPPVGGKHSPVPLHCGIYTVPVPNENAVHSMEHGAVWITYRPTLPPSAVKVLHDAARGKPYVVLSPYPGLPAPVVASAWGTQLKLDSGTDPRLADFITTYQQGPQTPEPGAACSGGVGTPKVTRLIRRTAAAVHRPVARRSARRAAHGRAPLGARPDMDATYRGDDRRASDEVTIVIVTHNMRQAARVWHYCAFFLAEEDTPGWIVESGPTEQIFERPEDPRTPVLTT
jgi:Protein of unknown function (DUF3105)